MSNKILLIDDERSVTDILEKFLTKEGYTPISANSAEEGLRKLKEEHPDIVLLDIRMPEMDGIKAMEKIREIAPKVAIIMVTALIDNAVAERTLELHATDYLTKPLDLQYLKRILRVQMATLDEDE